MIRLLSIPIFCFFSAALFAQTKSTDFASKSYSVNAEGGIDSVYYRMLSPYRDSIDKTMNEVLVSASGEFLKATPSSSLGNLLADAYLWAARAKFNPKADVAFMNHGGVRINRIAKGEVTRRTVFEVMPFDNVLVVAEIKGALLQEYLNRIAADGGGGGVAGVQFKIVDKMATEVLIGGKSLDLAKTYLMVNSDYTIDSGSGIASFKTLPQQRTGYLQRDAIIDYLKYIASKGKSVFPENSNRISK
jgi:2',3'-cyclic-nucleotide 2'-phosphodiesterase (5'-nucleotidase family)